MERPHIYAICLKGEIAAKFVRVFEERCIVLFPKYFGLLEEMLNWLKNDYSPEFMDFFFIDIAAFAKPFMNIEDYREKGPAIYQCVEDCVSKICGTWKPFQFNTIPSQLYLLSEEPELSPLLWGEYCRRETTRQFQLDDLKPAKAANEITEISLLDLESQVTLLKEVAGDYSAELANRIPEELNFQVPDQESVQSNYRERCRKFFELVHLFETSDHEATKAFKEIKKIPSAYSEEINRDIEIIQQRRVVNTRHDFQIIELVDGLLGDDVESFCDFLSDLTDKLQEASDRHNPLFEERIP